MHRLSGSCSGSSPCVVLCGRLSYNGLVTLRNRVDNAWSQIDVQLRRRYDLIPNLVETVKGYAAHEREAFEPSPKARAPAHERAGRRASRPQAENQITGALRQLFALAEAYPDLKANQNFLALQEELTATESKIAYARQFYNDQVLRLNTRSRRSRRTSIAQACSASRRASTSRPTTRHAARSEVQF